MSNPTPVDPDAGSTGFWSSRALGRAPLIIMSLVVTASILSDLAINAIDDTRIDAAGTLVTLLVGLGFYLLWTRSTLAFIATMPALVTSHLLDSFALIMLALPVMVGIVSATTTRLFSLAALGTALLWAALIPVSTPRNADAMWMALILILAGWSIGNFVGVMVDRRRQDQARVAEATRRAARAAQDERKSLARDLHDIVADMTGFTLLSSSWVLKAIFGFIVVSLFFLVGALFFHWLLMRGGFDRIDKSLPLHRRIWLWATTPDEFEKKLFSRTSLLQYLTFQFFAITVLLAMPVKLLLRLVFTIKYVWVTPWFNI